jgi:phage terminase large subunit GpA-like protein
VAIREWVKASFSRNEALDCRVYATAALHALKAYGLKLDLVGSRLAHTLPADGEQQGDDHEHDHEEPAPRAALKRRRESWLGPRRQGFL